MRVTQGQGQAIGEWTCFLLRRGAVLNATLLVGLSEKSIVEASPSVPGWESWDGDRKMVHQGKRQSSLWPHVRFNQSHVCSPAWQNDVDKCLSFSSRYPPDGFRSPWTVCFGTSLPIGSIVRISSQLPASDFTLVAWSRPWWEYLHHGKGQTLPIRAFPPPREPVVKYFQHTTE